jgi:hypothetical protein
MRFVILMVVGIISIFPGRVGVSLSFPTADSTVESILFRNPASAPSLHRVDSSQPLNPRRDYVIEAFFELEEEENQGLGESLFLQAGSYLPHISCVFTPVMTTRGVFLNGPIPSGRSCLLRC